MPLRYRYVTYRYTGGSQQDLERRYQQLWQELMRQSQQSLLQQETVWRPPLDIHETPDALIVRVELAGMHEEDIEVTLYEDALVITGIRNADQAHDETICYHEAQIRYGRFRAEVLVPFAVHRERVEAQYANGFLRISLPKAPPVKPEHVHVTGDEQPTKAAQLYPPEAAPFPGPAQPQLPLLKGAYDVH
jgi:HSP20 family protein